MNDNNRLNEVVRRVEELTQRGVLPVVVFDVDSTLVSAAVRHRRILQAFADERGDSRLLEQVKRIIVTDFAWTVEGPLRAAGYEDEEMYEALNIFWYKAFFSAEFAHVGMPTHGAVSFVRTVSEAGGFVYYLTARVAPVTGPGTVRLLQDWDFPILDGRSTLHLKPSREANDTDFKRDAVEAVKALKGEVVATFENEPRNANLFRESFPEALTFLVGDVHSPNPPAPHAGVLRVRNLVRP